MNGFVSIKRTSESLNLLYVEDDEKLREETYKLLKLFFLDVITAKDGEEGFLKYKNHQIDLVMTDINMPKVDGLEMIEKIRSIDSNIPIIIFSAYKNNDYLHKSITLNVDDYLFKPLDLNKLKNSLDRTLRKYNSNREINDLYNHQSIYKNNTLLIKLNSFGNIKYATDKFSKLLGYKNNELLNQPFDFIRKKSSYQYLKLLGNLAVTKNSWQGNLKAKRSTNKDLWFNTTITPTYDDNNKLIEFIVVFADITKDKSLKYYLEKELDKSKHELKEAKKLSSQYEMAINESSILTKTDTKGKITYVNEKFCKVSGYTKEELIGQHHNIIRHPDMSPKIFKDLWKTIKSGNCWQGLIKNKRKNAEEYWVSTTIIPIKNKKNKIKEFISIRHDLTKVFDLHKEIEETQRELIYKLGEVGETRSKETGNHVKRVAQYSKDLALLYGLSKEESEILFSASPMHDIGKIGIPDEILKKPSKLTFDEFEIMKTHASIGYNILKNSKRPVLKAAAIIAKEHHEKWNGTGYPDKLKGNEIHIYGRITALADVFDALGSNRYYKKAWEDEKIIKLIKDEKGKHFDPELVDLFLENMETFLKTRNKYKD